MRIDGTRGRHRRGGALHVRPRLATLLYSFFCLPVLPIYCSHANHRDLPSGSFVKYRVEPRNEESTDLIYRNKCLNFGYFSRLHFFSRLSSSADPRDPARRRQGAPSPQDSWTLIVWRPSGLYIIFFVASAVNATDHWYGSTVPGAQIFRERDSGPSREDLVIDR